MEMRCQERPGNAPLMAVAAVMLLFAIGCAALWCRSCAKQDTIGFGDWRVLNNTLEIRGYTLESGRGRVAVETLRWRLHPDIADSVREQKMRSGFSRRVEPADRSFSLHVFGQPSFLGFAVDHVDIETGEGKIVRLAVVLPYWFVVSTAALASALCWRRCRRLTRLASNPHACAHCGYDLRATPERCPECGTPVRKPPDSA